MNNKSFTLIELLVVIVIIGILAGVIMISTSSSISKANIAKLKVFDNSTRNSMITNLFTEYSFDEFSGTVNQAVVNATLVNDDWGSNNLYTEGGPILRDGNDCISGKCLDFINDSATNLNRIYTSSGFDFSSSAFTISYWVNKRGSCRYTSGVYSDNYAGGIMEIVEGGTGNVSIYHGIRTTEFVLYLCFSDGDTEVLALDMNKNILNDWHLITFSYNNSTKYVKAYLDGNIFYNDQAGINKTFRTTNNASVSIGKYTTYWTKGKMDEFRLYGTALSDAEVKQNYIAGLDSLLSNGSISKEDYDQRINELAYEE